MKTKVSVMMHLLIKPHTKIELNKTAQKRNPTNDSAENNGDVMATIEQSFGHLGAAQQLNSKEF